ncbi:MAG: pre-peptidase C-terminal domain-containing protein [Rhodoferax sp.]|nr:pre-peptidase C-terminal domain-containing protein [Rhodoferax sp.]
MKKNVVFFDVRMTDQQQPVGNVSGSTRMFADAAVDDYGDTATTSGTLAIGASVVGNIEVAGDRDWFKVSLNAGESYAFSLSQTPNGLPDPYLALYDSNGTLVTENDDTGSNANSQIAFIAGIGGAYYLSAQGFDQETGTYTLAAARTVVDDYGSTADTSADLPMNGSIAGDIEIASDTDWFKVSLIAGETYTFSLSQTTNGLTDPYLELYDPNSKLVARNDNSGDSSTDSKIVYFADFSGTYYLSARGSNAETGTYTLAATKIVDDYGNTASTSGTLAIDASVVGSVEVVGDQDWFKVELNAGEYYEFSLTQTPDGLADPYLELHDSNGTLVAENDNGSNSPNSRIVYSPSLSETYYLSARGHDAQTGTYTLAATKMVDDYGNTASTSAALAMGGSVVGNIEVAGDQDWFKLELDAGEIYGFSLTKTPNGLNGLVDPYLVLYDASGTLVAENDNKSASTDSQIL